MRWATTVWFDRNGNGIQDEATLDGLNGVTVRLYLSGGTSPVATTVTADDVNHNPGYYGFSGLTAFQAYFLEFVKPTGATFSPQNQGSDDNLDSDVDRRHRAHRRVHRRLRGLRPQLGRRHPTAHRGLLARRPGVAGRGRQRGL